MELWEIRCWNYYIYNMEEIGIWRRGLAILLLSKLVYVYMYMLYSGIKKQSYSIFHQKSFSVSSILNLCISLNSPLPLKIRKQIGLFTALKPFLLLNAITFLSSLSTLTIKYMLILLIINIKINKAILCVEINYALKLKAAYV